MMRFDVAYDTKEWSSTHQHSDLFNQQSGSLQKESPEKAVTEKESNDNNSQYCAVHISQCQW